MSELHLQNDEDAEGQAGRHVQEDSSAHVGEGGAVQRVVGCSGCYAAQRLHHRDAGKQRPWVASKGRQTSLTPQSMPRTLYSLSSTLRNLTDLLNPIDQSL